jgi:hypothetical protein
LANFHSVKSLFDSQRLSYFTFSPKCDKPIKAVIRHLPLDIPAKDIHDGLVNLGFDVIRVKQMTTTRRSSPEHSKITNLQLFLVTLPKTVRSQEIFRLPSLGHIAIRVEAYRAQKGLTQCHNCRQFRHVWANYKHPPRCLWCGGDNLHKECPEMENAASTPACCNCRLTEGENSHPANYRVCSHAKEELQRKKSKQSPKSTFGRAFTPTLATPGVSFAAALRATRQQQRPQAPQAQTAGEKPSSPISVPQQKAGQSVPAPNVNNSHLDNMLRVVTVVQQIMTEFNGAVSEEDK